MSLVEFPCGSPQQLTRLNPPGFFLLCSKALLYCPFALRQENFLSQNSRVLNNERFSCFVCLFVVSFYTFLKFYFMCIVVRVSDLWIYAQLWAAMWVLVIDHVCFERTLNCCVISPGIISLFCLVYFILKLKPCKTVKVLFCEVLLSF